MAINQLQIPTSQINSNVDPSTWAALGNLGNVYQKAQEDAATKATLSQLGQSPEADALTLLHSGIPSLATIGINMRQRGIEDARANAAETRANAELLIRQAQEARAAGDHEEADRRYEAARKALINLPLGAAPPPAAPPPNADVFNTGAPPLTPSPAVAAPPPMGAPPATASPAAGEPLVAPLPPSPNAPSQLLATGALSARAPVADRITSNIAAGQPATAGVTREQIADMMGDPTYRPLATAILQKQFTPDDIEIKTSEDGSRIIAVNKTKQTAKDITPPTPTGAPPVSKQEREIQGYKQAAIDAGFPEDQATAIAFNKGKMPTAADLPPGQQKRVDSLTDQVRSSQRVLTNIGQLRDLSKEAWGFPGATTASAYGATFLPNFAGGKSAVATQDLINAAHSNVANVAKGTFGARVTNLDVNLLKDLESSADQPDAVRQKIYDRAEKVFKQLSDEDTAEAEGIISHTRYKPGGQAGVTAQPTAAAPAPAPAATPAPAPAAAVAKPSLSDFMKRARAANPGVSDGELARYWKSEYGG